MSPLLGLPSEILIFYDNYFEKQSRQDSTPHRLDSMTNLINPCTVQ